MRAAERTIAPGSRPTILQIVPRLDTGGAELTTIEITEAIVRAGGRALVVADGGRMAGEVTRRGGELIAMAAGAKNPLVLAANAARLARIVRREGVHLIHARSRAPAWSALLAARRTGRAFVTTYHGAYNETNAAKRLYNGIMARGDVVIANSHYTADLIRRRYQTEDSRICVIHRGVDVRQFDPVRVAAERVAVLRRQWGVGPDDRVVLQAARLTSWKGQATLIAAAARLSATAGLDRAVIVLAGDDQGRSGYAAQLARQIAELGLAGRVKLAGHCTDMPAAYLAAHVTIVASVEPEAFGRTAAEAQAMGCPVIATNIGAPPETVLAEPRAAPDTATGWLVPPGDAAALADRIGRALDMSADAREALAKRARVHAIHNFSLQPMQRATLAVYDHLLSTALAPALDSVDSVNIPATPAADET
jgi:glycosyltransferase involved in cell wall biosynthesis